MRKIKSKITFVVLTLFVISVFIVMKMRSSDLNTEIIKLTSPVVGTIQTFISTTGIVLPKNRLEIKPPVGGRIESILVQEGEIVKAGQALARMSSTERAALLDAAEGQGEEVLKYWKEVYKAIPLLSPIDGEIIVATTQPGQTVTTNDAIVVLSDHLIVRAQVDETDIARIKLGQNAIISLDAYPDTKIKAKVEHIYYESKTVNNVTVYEVDLIPQELPVFFRSGMNSTINFVRESKENIYILPLEAVHQDKDESFVLLKDNGNGKPVKRLVKTGISDDNNIEIVSGLKANDKIIINGKKYTLPKSDIGGNPFLPFQKKK